MFKEQEIRAESVLAIAKELMLAARTAPKAKGIDNLEILLLEKAELAALSAKMKELGETYDHPTFIRDAGNVLEAECLVLLGTTINPLNLKKCGMCGFENCAQKAQSPQIPCVFNPGDLGIALGSLVSKAADYRLDNRILYTAGYAAIQNGCFASEVKIAYGVPLSAGSKNPFFDRK